MAVLALPVVLASIVAGISERSIILGSGFAEPVRGPARKVCALYIGAVKVNNGVVV